ncbi:hypothetical protein GCM10007877_32390 [Marinibactrum halimedae]|uniref:Uncharacterized protein n=1 Tax=Marinibactrum halimedae TaxID=1444977 RepID=A0AA37TD60_9GAMM|nr:hypothetical protein GCM10007877_32390 [Marinibactrum halimedae]
MILCESDKIVLLISYMDVGWRERGIPFHKHNQNKVGQCVWPTASETDLCGLNALNWPVLNPL